MRACGGKERGKGKVQAGEHTLELSSLPLSPDYSPWGALMESPWFFSLGSLPFGGNFCLSGIMKLPKNSDQL